MEVTNQSGSLTETELRTEDRLFPVKKEILVWIFTILSALLVYVSTATFINFVYHPDVASLKATGEQLLIGSGGTVRPEPMEAVLFRMAVLTMPFVLLGFYIFWAKAAFIKKMAAGGLGQILSLLSILSIVVLIFADLMAPNPFGAGNGDSPQTPRDYTTLNNFDFYFQDLFLGKHLLIYVFIIAPLICCWYFIGIKVYKWNDNKIVKIISSIIGYLVVTIVIAACIMMGTFNFPYQNNNTYDFSAVYYSMTQVYAGVPLLVNGFTTTYGLYAEFLNPIFQVIGLSIFKFSLVMSMLLGVSFALNFYCLKQLVKNKFLLFAGITSMIYISFLNIRFTEGYDSSFAYFPIRYVIPSTLLFLAIIYIKKRSRRHYYLSFIVLAAFVLWNPEFGIVSYLSWLMFLTFHDLVRPVGKIDFKIISIHWLLGACVLITIFYACKLMIFLCYGTAPDLGLLWSSMLFFGKYGFGLLPMSIIHPWNVIALILILGLVFSISRWVKKTAGPNDEIIFLLTIMSIGILFYFQGRSHNWCLTTSAGFAVLLLTVLTDKLWSVARNTNLYALNALFILSIYIISFSLCEVVTNPDKLYDLVSQADDRTNDAIEQTVLTMGKEFILRNTLPEQKIHILTIRRYQSLYFDNGKRRSAFNPGIIELFTNKDLERMEHELADSSFPVFLIPKGLHDLPFLSRAIAAVGATYQYKAGGDVMAMLSKRKHGIPENIFFNNISSPIFHRKYYDSPRGVRMRMDDADGDNAITLPADFSVEILYNSQVQIFDLATLIGNKSDSAGFAISGALNTPKCIFAINATGYKVPMPQNGWVYCVMNVFPDHFEVYANGSKIATQPIYSPLRNSTDKLRVGNLGYMHDFVGAISEVAITRNAMDSAKIAGTWNNIRQAFTTGR